MLSVWKLLVQHKGAGWMQIINSYQGKVTCINTEPKCTNTQTNTNLHYNQDLSFLELDTAN